MLRVRLKADGRLVVSVVEASVINRVNLVEMLAAESTVWPRPSVSSNTSFGI